MSSESTAPSGSSSSIRTTTGNPGADLSYFAQTQALITARGATNNKPGTVKGAFPASLSTDVAKALGLGSADVGSMEVKLAWKQLTEAEVKAGTYYAREYTLYDPTAPSGQECSQTAMMGLIGFHVIALGTQLANPEWVWGTFEHDLNVPTKGVNDGATSFSLHDPNCTPAKTSEECAAFDPTKDERANFKCCPNKMLYNTSEDLPEEGKAVPTQVSRLVNPTVSTILPTHCQQYYGQAIEKQLGNNHVLNNYFQVSTQWLKRAIDGFPPLGTVNNALNFPCVLRNTTMETFLWGDAVEANGCPSPLQGNTVACRFCNGDCAPPDQAAMACPYDGSSVPAMASQVVTSDCMGCHQKSAQNSSFLFGHRPDCANKDGKLTSECTAIQNKSDCTANTACSWFGGE